MDLTGLPGERVAFFAVDAKRLEGESDDELERRMMAQVFPSWRDPGLVREILPEEINEWRSSPELWEHS